RTARGCRLVGVIGVRHSSSVRDTRKPCNSHSRPPFWCQTPIFGYRCVTPIFRQKVSGTYGKSASLRQPAGSVSCPPAGRGQASFSSVTSLRRVPISGTCTSTTSPARRHLGGSKRAPAPVGVPEPASIRRGAFHRQ